VTGKGLANTALPTPIQIALALRTYSWLRLAFFNKPARQFHGHVAALVLQFTTLVHGAARFGMWAEDERVGKQLPLRYFRA